MKTKTEEIEAFRESVKYCPYGDLVGKNREILLYLCDSALRLADIENAGDEEVDDLRESYWATAPILSKEYEQGLILDKICDIATSRGLELAELRGRLREAEKFLKFAHEVGASFDSYNYESPEEKAVCEEWRKFIAESEVCGG